MPESTPQLLACAPLSYWPVMLSGIHVIEGCPDVDVEEDSLLCDVKFP